MVENRCAKEEIFKAQIEVPIKDRNIHCYLYADDNNPKYKFINECLDYLRNVKRNTYFTTGKDFNNCEIYVYDDDLDVRPHEEKVGIHSVRYFSDNTYVILIQKELFEVVPKELEEFFLHKDLKAYFEGNKKSAKYYSEKVFKHLIMFAFYHEYYHILNGHLKNPCILGTKKEKNKYSQILECNADNSAIRSCLFHLDETILDRKNGVTNTDVENLRMERKYLMFGVYFFFLKIQEISCESFSNIKDLLEFEHPLASIRIVYLLTNYVDCGMYSLDLPEVIEMMELCIYFDRVHYEASDVGKTLYAVGYTEEGLKHIQLLHDGWNEIIPKLEKDAYVRLRSNQPVDFTSYAWINERGEIKQGLII